ncbi:MAG TPA: SusD/RagB family nutrient-binding outer membrane lipoprotein [Chitinophaga sp.]
MKKNILIILMLVPVLGFISACKKSSFDDKYYNPEKTTKGTIDGLYTGIFKNRRVFPDYWNLFTFVSTTMGSYTQTTATFSDGRRYEQAGGYVQDRWDDFYTATGGDGNWTAPLPNYREMEKLYGELESDAEKQGYRLFLQTARIFLYDQATQMVDMWGDIPFTEAAALNATGELKLPAYDNASQIYDSALINLKAISQWLATVQPEQFYLNKLAKQDILLKGDLMKWRRYANSLILRLAMRISNVDETRGRTLVQEILGNPTLYPLLAGINDNVQLAAGKPDLQTNLLDAFGQNRNYAPDYMVDSLLDPSGDPRLRIFYTKNKNGIFQGLPKRMNRNQQDSMVSNGLVSIMDSTTFVRNQFFPGIVFTVAEVNFLIAEAYERWGGGSAKTYYEQGIRQSINYYYQKIHLLSEYGTPQTPPTESEITLLLAHPLVAYGTIRETNLNKIGLQKWVNFHVMQNNQAWAEMRRSGYPKLWFPVDNTSSTTPTPGYRLQYPANERSRNAENYAKVADKDKVYAKPFWMP